jgi:hypothetical protein
MMNKTRRMRWEGYVACKGKKGKAIPVTGCGGPEGCEMSRLPHFLDNQLTDGSEVVSLMCRLPFTARRFMVLISVRS